MGEDAARAFQDEVRRAAESRAGGDREDAARHLRRACAIRPGAFGVRCDLASVLRELGELEGAERVFGEVLVSAAPAKLKARAATGLGLAARQRGQPVLAAARFEAALAHDPANRYARVEAGSVLRELGRARESEQHLRLLLAAEPEHPRALATLGLIERERGDLETARALLAKAAALAPDKPFILSQYGAILEQLGRGEDAKAAYHLARAAAPDDFAPVRALARIAAERGQWAEAARLLGEWRARGGADQSWRREMGAVERASGEPARALATLGPLLERSPEDGAAWMELGRALRALDRREEALAAFLRAAETKFVRGMVEAASEHLALCDPGRARRALRRALEAAPADETGLERLAELELMSEEHERCVAVCDALIAAHPERAAGYRIKCRALPHLDRPAELAALLGEVDRRVPPGVEHARASLEILRNTAAPARTLARLAATREVAREDFALWPIWVNTCLALSPDPAPVRDMLAAAPARTAVQLAQVEQARGGLASAEWRLGDAVAAYEAALRWHRIEHGIHQTLARLHFLMLDVERALASLRALKHGSRARLLLRGESTKVSQNILGQLLDELNLHPAIRERLRAASAEPPGPRIDLLLRIVREQPDLTPPALQLCLAVRQSDAWARLWPQPRRSSARFDAGRVPRRIVQFWDRGLPDSVRDLMDGWRAMHPDYLYRRFDDLSARRYLRRHHHPCVLEAYALAAHPAQASDIFRLACLYREGGCYIDADDRCEGRLDTLIDPRALLVGYQEEYATIGNNFLACAPGEAVIGRALELAVRAMLRGDTDSIWLATGPGLLTRAFAQVMAEQWERWPEWLARRPILERTMLRSVLTPHCSLGYKRGRKSWLREAFAAKHRIVGVADPGVALAA